MVSLFSASMAVLLIYASVLLGIDSVEIHVRCPEHGELVHLGAHAAPAPSQGVVTIATVDAAAGGDLDEDRCTAWSMVECAQLRHHLQAMPAILVSSVSPHWDRPALTASRLLLQAPKTSPPPLVFA